MGKEDHKISDTFENLSASLAMLRKLEWRVRHAVESVLSGEYKSSFRGKGMEFDQVVKYEYGDDVRDIDWNVTARLGNPYVKRYVLLWQKSANPCGKLPCSFFSKIGLPFSSDLESVRNAKPCWNFLAYSCY